MIKNLLKRLILIMMKKSSFMKMKSELQSLTRVNHDLFFLKRMLINHSRQILENLDHSKSQLRQDLFVLQNFNFKKSGYFIEFGATNGIDHSNSYLLETRFIWVGY